MKELFGINVTYDKTNETADGGPIASAYISEELENQLRKLSDEAVNAALKDSLPGAKTPLPLKLLSIALFCGVPLLLSLAVKAYDKLSSPADPGFSLSGLFSKAPLPLIGAGALFLLWIGSLILIHFLKRRGKNDSASEEIDAQIGRLTERCYAELGVPSDAVSIDVLSYNYREAGSHNEVVPNALCTYLSSIYKAFIEDGRLCIAGGGMRHDIPLESIRSAVIRPANGTMTWHHDEKPSEGRFEKAVSSGTDSFGRVRLKSCLDVEFNAGSDVFRLLLPAYEACVFEGLTGLKPAVL